MEDLPMSMEDTDTAAITPIIFTPTVRLSGELLLRRRFL